MYPYRQSPALLRVGSIYQYTVQSGDHLYAIARHYESDPDLIARFNGLEHPEQLTVGEKLYIPVFENAQAPRVSPEWNRLYF